MLGLFASKAKIVPPPSRPVVSPAVAQVEVPEPVVSQTANAIALAGPVSRRPIVDANMKLHGYELLFDAGASTMPLTVKQDVESYTWLMPQSEATKGFVPATREMLLEGAALLPRNTVFEVNGEFEADDELIAACRQLRKRGHLFAIDGSLPEQTRTPMMECADYLTVDFEALDEAARSDLYTVAVPAQTKRVARRVATLETMQIAQKEGCKLFQGGFLSQPFVPPPGFKPAKTVPDNQLICLRLMTLLSEDPINLGSVEKLIMMDTALVYRLLRLVNSALYSLNSRITTIRSALVIVGTDEFRKLITMTLASIFATSNSQVQVTLAVERARFCEMLAPQLREPGPKLYLLGMLTMVDTILKLPMQKVLATLPLESDMTAALLGEPGVITDALDLVRAYQAGDWKTCIMLQQQLRVDDGLAAKTYLESALWADKVSSMI